MYRENKRCLFCLSRRRREGRAAKRGLDAAQGRQCCFGQARDGELDNSKEAGRRMPAHDSFTEAYACP